MFRSKSPDPTFQSTTFEYVRPSAHRRSTTPPDSPPRPKTHRSHTYVYENAKTRRSASPTELPWQQMAQTFTWVSDHGHNHAHQSTSKTTSYGTSARQPHITISASHIHEYARPTRPPAPKQRSQSSGRKTASEEELRQRMVDEMMQAYEAEAKRWMRQEEAVRRAAIEREQRAKVKTEEMYRAQARMRTETESARVKAGEDNRRREKAEKEKREKTLVGAWEMYESGWTALMASTSNEPLTFSAIPWPLVSQPSKVTGITQARLVSFLFSSLHSVNQSKKERIRRALLRWHPDRFRRVMGRVKESDKEAVEEGVGIVARCLNDLMAREASVSQHAFTR